MSSAQDRKPGLLDSELLGDSSWQMHWGERFALEGLLRVLSPQTSVEIGRAQGGSLRRIATNSRRVHSFDVVPEPPGLREELTNVEFHTGDSRDQLPKVLRDLHASGQEVDFALVDGDHSADGVRTDALSLLESDACRRTVVLFHDAANEEVRRGLEAVGFEAHPKTALVMLDWIPGFVWQGGPFPMEIWNGLGLVVLDRERSGPPIRDEFAFPSATMNLRAREALVADARSTRAPQTDGGCGTPDVAAASERRAAEPLDARPTPDPGLPARRAARPSLLAPLRQARRGAYGLRRRLLQGDGVLLRAADGLGVVLGQRSRSMPPQRLFIDADRTDGSHDQREFVWVGESTVSDMMTSGLQPHHRVLEVGCGIGRLALPLTRRLHGGAYDGIEITSEKVAYCEKTIAAGHPGFRFHHADIFNRYYNPGGRLAAGDYVFPFTDDEFDYVFLVSVFTHMLPPDMEHYMAEIARVLRPGGRTYISYFVEWLAPGDPFFTHTPVSMVMDSEEPEHAVVYAESYVLGLYRRHGLQVEQLRRGVRRNRTPSDSEKSPQDVILAVNPIPGGS
jgi:SAM-dependent methyltransferase